MERESFSNDINKRLDSFINQNYLLDNEPRTYLGASAIGEDCYRLIWYNTNGLHPDYYPSAQIVRRFQMGHLMEEVTAKLFKGAGYNLLTTNEWSTQFGFEDLDGKIQGHLDGIFFSSNESILQHNIPIFWEHKIMKDDAKYKKWQKLKENGVQKSHPNYYSQIQFNMGYMRAMHDGFSNIRQTILTAFNTNTSEYHHELVEFDSNYAQGLVNKAYIIATTTNVEALPRISKDREFYKCKYCAYRDTCWEGK